MIVIRKLKFENVFSYGKNNSIDLDKDTVTQLLGENGAGKSSIATILEEAFYNKNSRGIKKADICNRNTNEKSYKISAYFDVDKDTYELHKVVKSSAKLSLIRNGEDISGHTTTQTYKLIESDILKLDFSTFTKLVYQSMISSLDFLKATDTARKNFLIGLLGLEAYSEAEQSVKAANKEAKLILAGARSSVSVIQSWIDKHAKIEPLKEEVPEVEYDYSLDDELNQLKSKKLSIDKDNESISINKANKAKLDSLLSSEPNKAEDVSEDLLGITKQRDIKQGELQAAKRELSKLQAVKEKCPTCGTLLDISETKKMLQNYKKVVESLNSEITPLSDRVDSLTEQQTKYKNYKDWSNKLAVAKESYTPTLPDTITSVNSLNSSIASLQTSINKVKEDIRKATKHNKEVSAHNTRVKSNREQLEKYKLEIAEKEQELEAAKDVVADLDILSDSLGTKGLIQYKIESMVKVFETLINDYLFELSSGRFVLSFVIADTKLSLKLYDNSTEIDIKSLSSGEFAKVNTATLLAVRKMMSAVSKVNINLVIFDEVISVLDEYGKETLVEILLKENDLNSVLVSHGYNHPLARVIEINKKEKISCITS